MNQERKNENKTNSNVSTARWVKIIEKNTHEYKNLNAAGSRMEIKFAELDTGKETINLDRWMHECIDGMLNVIRS